ncbi:MAG: hypothetical protein ACRETL_04450 [Gammaproteobacteria bacterium]
MEDANPGRAPAALIPEPEPIESVKSRRKKRVEYVDVDPGHGAAPLGFEGQQALQGADFGKKVTQRRRMLDHDQNYSGMAN